MPLTIRPLKQFDYMLTIKPTKSIQPLDIDQFEVQTTYLPVMSKGWIANKVKFTHLVIGRILACTLVPWALILPERFDLEISLQMNQEGEAKQVYWYRNCSLVKSVLTNLDRAESQNMMETLTIKVRELVMCS